MITSVLFKFFATCRSSGFPYWMVSTDSGPFLVWGAISSHAGAKWTCHVPTFGSSDRQGTLLVLPADALSFPWHTICHLASEPDALSLSRKTVNLIYTIAESSTSHLNNPVQNTMTSRSEETVMQDNASWKSESMTQHEASHCLQVCSKHMHRFTEKLWNWLNSSTGFIFV